MQQIAKGMGDVKKWSQKTINRAALPLTMQAARAGTVVVAVLRAAL
jgi:hypothetical protein